MPLIYSRNFRWSDKNNYGSDGNHDPIIRGLGSDKFGQVYLRNGANLYCLSSNGDDLGVVSKAEIEAYFISRTGDDLGFSSIWVGFTLLAGGEYIIGHASSSFGPFISQIHCLMRCRDGQEPELVGASWIDSSKRFESHDAYIMGAGGYDDPILFFGHTKSTISSDQTGSFYLASQRQ